MTQLEELKQGYIADINLRQENQVIERNNADLLIKLINNADSAEEASAIATLGTLYNKTGLTFDVRLEKNDNKIKYLQRNNQLSFTTDPNAKTHKLIIGDNYPALLNLLINYKKKIDIIYIDPPYGKDSMGEFAKTNYENAISRDNLLSMLYPRLKLAKDLMAEHGVIYCSIDNRNQAYLKCLFDEIFGENNFIGLITQNKGNAQNDAVNMQKNSDYILVYCKNKKYTVENNKVKEMPILQEGTLIKKEVFVDDNGKYYYKGSGLLTGSNPTLKDRPNLGWTCYYNPLTKDKIAIQDYDLELAKTSNNEEEVYATDESYIAKGYITIRPPRKNGKLGRWTWKMEKFNKEKDKILITENNTIIQKVFVELEETTIIDGKRWFVKDSLTKNTKSIWDFSSAQGSTELSDIIITKDFDNPKNVEMIKKLIEIYREKENPIVLDFFAGSGTTGQAVLELNQEDEGNRTFILCTNNEITDENPCGIAYGVTSKRLKRTMTGECYDSSTNFKWLEKHSPYGDNLEVLDIVEIENFIKKDSLNPFEVIDETIYGKSKFTDIKDKIEWVCKNFDRTQKHIEDKES